MKRLLALAVLTTAATLAVAADDPALTQLRDKMQKLFGIKAEDVQPSPIAGLYEVNHKHEIAYVTADGKFMVHGDIVNLDSGEEITEEHRRADRVAALSSLGPNSFISFAPPPPLASRYIVTVFTDVDCGYCRKLHSEMAAYNAKGIEIRYAFWPRSGPDTPSWYRAEAVWCSANQRKALTEAKLGADIPTKTHNCDNPVAHEYELGMQLGIRGTPAMFLPDGEMLDGYVPPDWLAQHLAEADETAAATKTASQKN
jgi:thiol:disulfide interchange protein DsbC